MKLLVVRHLFEPKHLFQLVSMTAQEALHLCSLRRSEVECEMPAWVSGLWRVQPDGDDIEYKPLAYRSAPGRREDVPCGRRGAAYALSGDTLFVFGGQLCEGVDLLSDLWALDIRSGKWRCLHQGVNGSQGGTSCRV